MQQATPATTDLRVVPVETFEQAFQAWLDWMNYRELSPNTIKLYSRTVEVAQVELGDLRDLEQEELDAWIQAKGGKAGTKGNRICALTSFYRFLVKTKRRIDNPATELERPKLHKRLPKPVENLEAALKRLDEEDEIANIKGAIPRRVGETRDMAVFLCETGLRIHEAVKCNWPVPCPTEMTIIGKGSKEAMIPITQKAQDAWNRLDGKWPIGARATQRRFEKAGELAFTPHQCRHWRATSLVRAGVPIATVSKIMRHENIQTTMGYSQFAQDMFREALALVP